MSIVKNASRLVPAARSLSTTAAKNSEKMEVHEGFKKLKKIQELYQKPDGKPVFLKRGASDQIFYRLTMAGCLVGLGGIFKLFYDLS